MPGGRREAAPCRRGGRPLAARRCRALHVQAARCHRQARRSTHATFQAVTRASSAALFCSALSAWEPEADGRDAISLSRRGPTPHPQNEPSACDFAGRALQLLEASLQPQEPPGEIGSGAGGRAPAVPGPQRRWFCPLAEVRSRGCGRSFGWPPVGLLGGTNLVRKAGIYGSLVVRCRADGRHLRLSCHAVRPRHLHARPVKMSERAIHQSTLDPLK